VVVSALSTLNGRFGTRDMNSNGSRTVWNVRLVLFLCAWIML